MRQEEEEVEGVKLVRWGRPHRGEGDPTKGLRGSQAGRARRSRTRATPEQPGGEGNRMNFEQVKKVSKILSIAGKISLKYCQNIIRLNNFRILPEKCLKNILLTCIPGPGGRKPYTVSG